MTLRHKRLRFGLPNDVGLLTAFLPSEWQDFNAPPSPAVAAANLLLPDVIKGSWSSEWWRGPFFRPFSASVRSQGDTLGLQHCPDAAWVGQRLMPGLWGVTPGNFLNGLKSFFITIWIGTWRHSFNLRGELTLPTPQSLRGQAKRQPNKFSSGVAALR